MWPTRSQVPVTQRLLASRLSSRSLFTEPCRSATMRTSLPVPVTLVLYGLWPYHFEPAVTHSVCCSLVWHAQCLPKDTQQSIRVSAQDNKGFDNGTFETDSHGSAEPMSAMSWVAARTGLACHRHLSTAPDASYLPRPTRACYSAQPPVRSHPILN